MKPQLNTKQIVQLALVLGLLSAPPALAEMRVVVTEDGTIQFVHVGEGIAAEVPARAALARPSMGAMAEEEATGSAAAQLVTGSSAAAPPPASASVAAELGVSDLALAEPREAGAADSAKSEDAFVEAKPLPAIVHQEAPADSITAQFNACETISFGDTVLFDTAEHVLKAHAGPALDAVANVLLAQPSIQVRIEGHTDSRGGVQYNQALSERRANAVYQALLQRGVQPRRLEIVGFGLTLPTDTNDTAAGRANNRRVDLVPLNC